ncbi:10227_t:CDS:1, partial [Racocetra persica]
QERYQDPQKQEAIEKMRQKQIKQILFKANEVLFKYQKSPFTAS